MEFFFTRIKHVFVLNLRCEIWKPISARKRQEKKDEKLVVMLSQTFNILNRNYEISQMYEKVIRIMSKG